MQAGDPMVHSKIWTMANIQRHLSLGAKLAWVGTPFLLIALVSTGITLWISWQLDGGAAAVNEAGRMRMQAYRMALAVGGTSATASQELPMHISGFNASLELLRNGNSARPLQVPWDDQVRMNFSVVEKDWIHFHHRWLASQPTELDQLEAETTRFTADIDTLVSSIETHLSVWTDSLHLLQTGVLLLGIMGSATLLFAGYRFVLEPVTQLARAITRIQAGDFGARVDRVGSDEFGALAEGFNGMATHLQSLYGTLESKVQEKTAELEEKRERLEFLLEVTGLVAHATSLEDLARDFSQRLQSIAKADGVALRWSDQARQRYLMLAADGLPQNMINNEGCLVVGNCYCGVQAKDTELSVISVNQLPRPVEQRCAKAGFETIVSIPIRVHERVMGEANLFFRSKVTPTLAERSLLEALNSHLASAIENLRLNAKEREAAVSGERHHLSRELHDSIAQSLAFLKIQVQLMRDAMAGQDKRLMQSVLEEIDLGVRECYGDVRELLVHFRTRVNDEDIETALASTLRKFERQTGLNSSLEITGHGLPLGADVQTQVLHIVQEALSNVRKHAQASMVWLRVQQQPVWTFEIVDDGIGFDTKQTAVDETHVGLQIMAERAQRIGAVHHVLSSPGHGCNVQLVLTDNASTK
jgi:two-component system nitrate/nitrite sensor histidine kinase NarX